MKYRHSHLNRRKRSLKNVRLILLFLIDLNKLIICQHHYNHHYDVREHITTQQATVRISVNKASISCYICMYIYIYSCGAMLFTLNKVVISIDVYDGLNSINTWTVFVLSANWNVQVDRTHTKLFYSHLIVHGQLIDCWRKSSSELYTAGSFLYGDVFNEHIEKRKKKPKANFFYWQWLWT